MQIKTTMSYHLTPVRMVSIKKTRNNECCLGCRENETLMHCLWEYKLVQPLRKVIWKFLTKLNIGWSTWVAQLVECPTLGFHSGHGLGLWDQAPRWALCSVESAWNSLSHSPSPSAPSSLKCACTTSLSLSLSLQ